MCRVQGRGTPDEGGRRRRWEEKEMERGWMSNEKLEK